MNDSFIIELETGTVTRHFHTHNGYFAGVFASIVVGDSVMEPARHAAPQGHVVTTSSAADI